MQNKFKGKYRNESARLQNWDYGSNASYFITICTQNREHYFGQIENKKMQVTPAGAIAYVLWHEIKNREKNIELGEFVVMPNHVHGILIIDGNDIADIGRDVVDIGRVVACNVPTNIMMDTMNVSKNKKMAAISPKPNTISTIIRSYKSAVTKKCNRLGLVFAWQPRFHDHIIRDSHSFKRISEYIKNNPANWNEDKLN
jgi:putative transposase